MGYKTIIVRADGEPSATERYRAAIALAKDEQAHLVGLGTTLHPRWLRQLQIGMPTTDVDSYLDTLEQQSIVALDKLEQQARRLELDSFERRLVRDDLVSAMSLHARYADLVILSQPAGEALLSDDISENAAAIIAVQSGVPVLVMPSQASIFKLGDISLVAWDASREARVALQHALPILSRAKAVHVAVFKEDDRRERFGPEAGADIALYLARHGIRVEVHQREVKRDIGNALLELALDLHAEMLVMGCYGHHRYREMILGGVTRTVLQNANLPVLIAH
ncbi:universal stress protein [Noviherbaspirillum malthae]|uniref:universal stress protein n=1 Tax=Noviherbaspirillum malthae TaxID=1260987 RepID=UPI00188E3EB2|nr:universal stress protein [Noviherbaspirillum malthae]